MTLGASSVLGSGHLGLPPEGLRHPENPGALSCAPRSLPSPLAVAPLLSVSLDLPPQDTLCRWSHTTRDRLPSLSVSEARPCGSMPQSAVPFLGWMASHRMFVCTPHGSATGSHSSPTAGWASGAPLGLGPSPRASLASSQPPHGRLRFAANSLPRSTVSGGQLPSDLILARPCPGLTPPTHVHTHVCMLAHVSAQQQHTS